MVYKYKITFLNQLANAWSIFALFAGFVGLGIYQTYVKHYEITSTIVIYLVIFLSQLVPLIIIHVNYLKVNKKDTLEYDSKNQQMCFKHDDIECRFNLNDIIHVTRFASFRFFKKGPNFLAWDTYNHSVIELEDGKKITITSLLIVNLQIPIDKSKIEIHEDIFRLAKGLSFQDPGESTKYFG